jgi:hypothetical protein
MSEVAQRNFQNYELGDNVYELAGGLIPEIADRLDFGLSDTPDSGEMFKLVGVLGKNKVLRNNQEVTAIDLETAADLLERSGVQDPLDRSLWTPGLKLTDLDRDGRNEVGFTVLTGAVANWQDRAAQLVAEGIEDGSLPETVHVVTGTRVMDTKSDQSNPNVQAFHEEEDRYPTESEYSREFVLPTLALPGATVSLTFYDTDKGERVASNFVTDHKRLFLPVNGTRRAITFARVANAGVQLATQFRGAVIERVNPDFDNEEVPEVFVRTDDFPIARTEEQKGDPANYQSPYTGLRQAVLTAKLLHETVTA